MCVCSLSVTVRQFERPAAQSLSLPGANWSFQPGSIDDHGVYSVMSAAAGAASAVIAAAIASRDVTSTRRAFTRTPGRWEALSGGHPA
jgi:hypothetical protein